MGDIIRLIISTLSADAELAQWLGVRTGDPRIYRYYEPDAVIKPPSQRAYITIAQTGNPERTAAVHVPTFTLALWGLNYEPVLAAVRARVVALLDYTERPQETLTTYTGRVVHPMLIGEHDSAQENTKFAGIQLTFRFGSSAV